MKSTWDALSSGFLLQQASWFSRLLKVLCHLHPGTFNLPWSPSSVLELPQAAAGFGSPILVHCLWSVLSAAIHCLECKALSLARQCVHTKNPLAPYQQFMFAVEKLGPPRGDSPTPLPVVWQARKTISAAIEVVSVAGLQVYVLPTTHAPEAVYTDGSKLGDPPSSGAAAVLRDGRVAVCRVPGAPNSYKAELVGILLGSHFSAEREKLCLDCQGAILSSQGNKPPLRQAHWVRQVRSSLQQKGQSLEWVEGHVGHQYNELSDHYAKVGTLPPPPPRPPHLTVGCHPSGRNHPPPPQGMDARPDSLPPTRTLPPGLVEASHTTPPHMAQVAVWFAIEGRVQPLCHILARRVVPCALQHCGARHNDSVHGVLAHCSPTNPLVAAWLSAWPTPSLLANWRSTATRRDLRIIGCLAIPRTLYRYLALHHGGLRAARVAVGKFQHNALNAVNASLESAVPRPSNRPCPFRPEDWR